MPLHIAQEKVGTHVVLVATGDLDLATAPDLTEAADALIDAGAHDVVIDVPGLAFCDSSGLGAFVRIANRVRPDGGRLALSGPSPIVHRVLEVSGLTEAFIVAGSVAEAIGRLDAS
jgi:anti-sigma B factor antagonist